jgi:hypothetical protein
MLNNFQISNQIFYIIYCLCDVIASVSALNLFFAFLDPEFHTNEDLDPSKLYRYQKTKKIVDFFPVVKVVPGYVSRNSGLLGTRFRYTFYCLNYFIFSYTPVRKVFGKITKILTAIITGSVYSWKWTEVFFIMVYC